MFPEWFGRVDGFFFLVVQGDRRGYSPAGFTEIGLIEFLVAFADGSFERIGEFRRDICGTAVLSPETMKKGESLRVGHLEDVTVFTVLPGFHGIGQLHEFL